MNGKSIRIVFAAFVLMVVNAASGGAAPATRLGKALPDCDDTKHSNSEIDAAVGRAMKNLEAKGIDMTGGLNSPNFLRLMDEAGKELGCRLTPGH